MCELRQRFFFNVFVYFFLFKKNRDSESFKASRIIVTVGHEIVTEHKPNKEMHLHHPHPSPGDGPTNQAGEPQSNPGKAHYIVKS